MTLKAHGVGEIRGMKQSVYRNLVDPNRELPEVILVPDRSPNYHKNTSQHTLIDVTHGGAGAATIVRTPGGERYFTRLEIADTHLDREVRLAAYLLAIEDTVIRRRGVFTNDQCVDRAADVAIWHELAAAGVAQIEEDFSPMNHHGQTSSSDLFVGRASVLPPDATSRG